MAILKNHHQQQDLNNNNKSNNYLRLYLTTFSINIFSFASGIAYSWSSPALPKLNGSIEPELNPLNVNLSKQEESWVAALLSLGSALSPLIFGHISKKIGGRNGLIIGALPFAVSYIILAYANEVYLLYIGRLLCGFGSGAGFTIVPSFIGEIASDEIRGKLGCFMPITFSFGLLFSYVLGPYISLTWFNLINIIPPLIFILLAITYVPESPYYLLSKKQEDNAKKSIALLRSFNTLTPNNKAKIEEEINVIQKNLLLLNQGDDVKFKDLFKTKGLRKALLLTTGTMFFQQMSGITPVLSYMQIIFDESGSSLSPQLSVIIVGIIVCLISSIAAFLVDKLGRKLLLLTSCFLMCISQLMLGIYFIVKLDNVQFIPICCLIVFVFGYYGGMGNVPWILVGELFPSNVKSITSSISAFVCLSFSFLITVIYPYIGIAIGTGESFIIFSVFCLLGFIFEFILLPETKGISLYDIQLLMNK